MFAGVAAGIATLAADARSEITSSGADVSLYKPENGPALNIFVGSHVHEYLTVQGNYVWNRNDVTLTSVRTTDSGPSFYDAPRASSQHAFIGDLLVYFRERRSAIRPYLSAGVGRRSIPDDGSWRRQCQKRDIAAGDFCRNSRGLASGRRPRRVAGRPLGRAVQLQ